MLVLLVILLLVYLILITFLVLVIIMRMFYAYQIPHVLPVPFVECTYVEAWSFVYVLLVYCYYIYFIVVLLTHIAFITSPNMIFSCCNFMSPSSGRLKQKSSMLVE
jgi:hypothetical protein